MTIQRYFETYDQGLAPAADGDCCYYSDVAPIIAERDELKRRLDAVKKVFDDEGHAPDCALVNPSIRIRDVCNCWIDPMGRALYGVKK
jgi:hypothetical protein